MYNFSQLTQKFEKAIDHIQKDLGSLRTGKASPQLLDPVMVEVYGSKMRVAELANVSAPDANMVVVAPWDKSILGDLEKAIASASLNVNPVVDGDIIRIVVPSLTEERRKEMVKILYQKMEAGKVMLRNIRIDAKKEIEKLEEEDGVSEDDTKSDLQELDSVLKKYTTQLEEIAKKKEADLMTV
ncbi:MAG: ribosome recycling factor [Candidatus Pacebacteria bacterium]|nr:ribosome recycling factor [Candidatus Paceibacterota bacterium]